MRVKYITNIGWRCARVVLGQAPGATGSSAVTISLYFYREADYSIGGAQYGAPIQNLVWKEKMIMQRMLFKAIGLSLGIVLSVALMAQTPAKKPAKSGRLSGTVQMITKDKSEITLRNSSNVQRVVIYSGDTKFNMGSSKKSTPSSIDQVKEGNYMYCGGTWSGVKLASTSCTFRAQK
jgi:hypothetical protein